MGVEYFYEFTEENEVVENDSFFFQAEDGIRGFCRCRGLGDVDRGQCQGCVRDVSGMCQGCVRDVSGMCQGCVRDVSGMLSLILI